MAKKLLYTAVALTLCLSFCAAAVLALSLFISRENTAGATVDPGQSAVYTRQDINGAAGAVKATFRQFRGCRLHSLTYAGDEESRSNLHYCNSLREGAGYTQCVVFRSSFRSPHRRYGAWEPDTEYTWDWYVARKPHGNWTVVSYGYG